MSSYYDRQIPDIYSNGSDDLLMRSLIDTYAVEGKTDGAPNGHFFMTKDALVSVSKEIAETHMGFHGAKRDAFVKTQFDKFYPYADVLKDGFLPVARATVLLRQMLPGAEIAEGLQVQLDADVKTDREHLNVQFRPNAVQQPWSAKPEDAPPQSKFDKPFTIHSHKSVFYDREVPEKFSKEADDRLMNSLISKYSLEGNTGGKPNGHFFLNKEGVTAVATEVVATHMGFKGEKLSNYLKQNLPGLWNRYDVMQEGNLDADRVAVLLR